MLGNVKFIFFLTLAVILVLMMWPFSLPEREEGISLVGPSLVGAKIHQGKNPFSITGDLAKGKVLFRQKGCSTCHAIRGVGGKVGPDLAKIRHFHSAFGMAGILWNHSVHMASAGEKSRITRPVFKGKELADVIAYLHSLEVIGDPEEGEKLFERKGCTSCHRVAGKGGKIAPDLAGDHPHPPSELIGLMWNHALVMASIMKALDIPWPVFEAGEMADLLAYIAATQQARKKPAIRRPGKR